jgi:hypothetical protein
VKLADETMKDLDVAPGGRSAVGRDARGYLLDKKLPAADFYRVNTSTGERTLIAKGQWTKKAGFYELAGGQMRELVYEDASFSTPVKARKADRFLFTRQTFVEFPDLRVSGPRFADSKKITDANPQQQDFLWGHRVLVDFKNRDGVRLQGILAVPDDYKPGEKRPISSRSTRRTRRTCTSTRRRCTWSAWAACPRTRSVRRPRNRPSTEKSRYRPLPKGDIPPGVKVEGPEDVTSALGGRPSNPRTASSPGTH